MADYEIEYKCTDEGLKLSLTGPIPASLTAAEVEFVEIAMNEALTEYVKEQRDRLSHELLYGTGQGVPVGLLGRG